MAKKRKKNSNYFRKREFLAKMSRRAGRRVWGWEFKVKPWRKVV